VPESPPTNLDRLALAIGLGGVLVAVVIAMIGQLLGHNFVMPGFGVFAAAQVAAIVLGVITRASLIGRAAAITSGILLVASVLFVA